MRTRHLRALVAALPLAALLVTVLAASAAAQANRGFDIMTLVGPGSTIGVEISELDTASVERGDNGVVIKSVRQGTPASRAGLQAGDIVLEFDGERVRSVRQFRRLVEETPPGRQVEAVVLRDKSRRTLTVTPEGSSTRVPEAGRPAVPFVVPAPRVQPAEPFSFERRLPGLVPGIPVQGRLGATVMSLDAIKKISPEDQKTIETIAKAAQKKLRKVIRKANDDAKSTMARKGVQIVTSPPEMIAEFTKASAEVQKELAGKVYSKEELDMVLKHRDEFRAKNKK